jgi:hypothetical protein
MDKNMVVECINCAALVNGEVIASYQSYVDEDTLEQYTFLKCPKCSRPFIMLEVQDVQEATFYGQDLWDEPQRLYPPSEMSVSRAIPDSLRLSYEEARSCLRARAYTATAIMCRKTLEGIAEEHQITARNLAAALKEMKDKGIIENRLYEWADVLRTSGNDAAHSVNSRISVQDAKDILEFTHALLEYVFTFQEKFQQFKQRRSSSKENAT